MKRTARTRSKRLYTAAGTIGYPPRAERVLACPMLANGTNWSQIAAVTITCAYPKDTMRTWTSFSFKNAGKRKLYGMQNLYTG